MRIFELLMMGATWYAVMWLADFERLREQVYTYNGCEKTAVFDQDLEWPIVWCLARYNKKHVVCPRELPAIK